MEIAVKVSGIPPRLKAAAIGTTRMAKNIITPLNEISPAYGEKTADKSIKDDNESAETQRVFIRNAENSGEQFTAGNKTG